MSRSTGESTQMPDAEAGKIYRKQTLCWKRKKKADTENPISHYNTQKKTHREQEVA